MMKIDPNNYTTAKISDINRYAKENPEKFVKESEDYYNSQLDNLVDKLVNTEDKIKIILLCGPTSSGKTTTSHKLKKRLIKNNIKTSVLSMDNFFLGIKNYPLRYDGKPDMESVETLDIALLNSCIKDLLEKGKAEFPLFDFEAQSRLEKTDQITLGEDEIVIIEGIHALNPKIFDDLPADKIFKLYVSVRTKFQNDDGSDVLRPSEIRLIRRMVRDTLFRDYPVKHTIEYWQHVLDSERRYINPYRDDVDYKMDTTIYYEACSWHQLMDNLLTSKQSETLNDYSFVKKILDALLKFEELSPELVPKNSLLREFIG